LNASAVSGLLGFELTIATNASLIAEWMWDSPFLNFRDLGKPDQQGRFVFNPGIRIYPELIPNMVLDLGFVGDGEFEFSFGISYVATLIVFYVDQFCRLRRICLKCSLRWLERMRAKISVYKDLSYGLC